MSLADLPDVLIAHLTTYLSYEDTCNLMETSKKNCNAIKSYGKDKLNTTSISVEMEEGQMQPYRSSDKIGCKSYYFKNIKKFARPIDAVVAMLKECRDKVTLYLSKWSTDRTVWMMLKEAKNKIDHIWFEGGKVDLSAEELILLCQTFKESGFEEIHFNEAIWSDRVLVEILPFTEIIRRESRDVVKSSAHQITDRTLKSLIGENSEQTRFAMGNLRNSCTIKQILELLKVIETREIAFIDWNLGILNHNQNADADLYFGQYEGEIGRFEYKKYQKRGHTSYKLTLDLNVYDEYYYDEEAHLDVESVIYFSVSKR